MTDVQFALVYVAVLVMAAGAFAGLALVIASVNLNRIDKEQP